MPTTEQTYAALSQIETHRASNANAVLAPPELKEAVRTLTGIVLILAQKINDDALGGHDAIAAVLPLIEDLLIQLDS